MNDIRPFEEYKEMIIDMRKEEMIRGLYDLSARVTKQNKEIERLNNIINKGIEYILGNDLDNFDNINNLLNILKGYDKNDN